MAIIDPSNLVDQILVLMTKFLVDIPGKLISTSLDSGLVFSLWENFFGNSSVIQAALIVALSIGIFTAYTNHNVLRGGKSGGKM